MSAADPTPSSAPVTSDPAASSEQALAHANVVLLSAREELTRADGKASLLLAASGVALGALMAALLTGDWTPSNLDNRIEWLWWIGVSCAAAGLVLLGYAIYPRTTAAKRDTKLIAYYADVVAAADELEDHLEATIATPSSPVVDQLKLVSGIVVTKYEAIRRALWAFAGAGAACTLAVLINLPMQ